MPDPDSESDFTIAIAHRGSPMGLWMTIQSIESELAGSNYRHNYSIVVNGEGKELNRDLKNVLYFFEKSNKKRDLRIFEDPLSPPTARNYAAEYANGKYIFFFDNHCLVGKNYFNRAIQSMERYGMDMLHSTTNFYCGEYLHYHYELQLTTNFWAKSLFEPKDPENPYRVAAGGHGGWVIRNDVWKEVGGYWDGFTGYGGEEIQFDLGMWLRGKNNWLDPKLIHYHYAGARGYGRHYTDDYFTNMLMCAWIIGGEPWAWRVFESFTKQMRVKTEGREPRSMYELMQSAEQRSRLYRAQFGKIRNMSLEDLLEFFKREDIAH